MRLLPLLCAALLAGLALAGMPTVALARSPLDVAGQLVGAPAVSDLRAAQANVDAALKARAQKLDAWQRAAIARDAAAADVAKKKRSGIAGVALEDALKGALRLEEETSRSRSSLLAAEATVAQRGAALLSLYDAFLVEKRRVLEGLPSASPARAQAVTSYKDLAAQRDAVRKALLPVLAFPTATSADLPKGIDLDVRADDDVESLLEKADLARDLEVRFLRQAEAVKKRISEMEEERALAKDVTGMIGRSQLFDEEDRRLVVVRSESTPSSSSARSSSTSTGGRVSQGGQPAPADPGFAGDADDGAPVAQDNELGSAAPPPAVVAPAPSPVAVIAPPATLVRSEQGFAAPSTGIASLGTDGSLASLKALESKLKAQAVQLRDRATKLKLEAESRARE